ncbi:small multi-drug export protein, partial [Streptococcus sp. SPC0]|nr:small multi-drug export protein [Streptococcus sp. SPC0]
MNYIITFLISMIPLVELRGAVPFAIANGIPLWEALAIGVVGNMLPVPIIFFFARKVLEWGA